MSACHKQDGGFISFQEHNHACVHIKRRPSANPCAKSALPADMNGAGQRSSEHDFAAERDMDLRVLLSGIELSSAWQTACRGQPVRDRR